jgi:Sulfotransferase domain
MVDFKKKFARLKSMTRRASAWRQFARHVRGRRQKLLYRLDRFPDAILVSGCQRSGSTMIAQLITQSGGMARQWWGKDPELDAALILSGAVEHRAQGRYCFQTTYLNECYREYFEHETYRMVWMLRNPESVVYSMVYNWSDFALNELFHAVGVEQLGCEYKDLYSKYGLKRIDPIRRASYAYVGKVGQLFELVPKLGRDKILVMEYDAIVREPESRLRQMFDYIRIPWNRECLDYVNRESVRKKERLDEDERRIVRDVCENIYERASKYADHRGA